MTFAWGTCRPGICALHHFPAVLHLCSQPGGMPSPCRIPLLAMAVIEALSWLVACAHRAGELRGTLFSMMEAALPRFVPSAGIHLVSQVCCRSLPGLRAP